MFGVIVAGLAVSGCPFDPRDAPQPCTPGTPGCSTPPQLVDPITATIAFENIQRALRKRSFDGPYLQPNYEESLAPTFVYVPDADASATASNRDCGPGVPFFANWGRDRELRFMEQILVSTSTPPDTVELTYLKKTEKDEVPDQDVTRFEVEYVLSLVYAAHDSTARVAQCYTASALWDFSGVLGPHFLLARWEDLGPLAGAACPGGTVPGTVGMLRATDGTCDQ